MDRANFHILLVDDEKEILESLKIHFEMDGYSVQTANSAKEALRLLKNQPFDLVFTDINMPEVDGLELLEKIKQIRGATIVVMMTAYTSLVKVLVSRVHGAFDYVLKPFRDLDEIDRVVDRAVHLISRWDHIMEETRENKTEKKAA